MDTIYAWVAGFIDGEGTITLKRTKARTTINGIDYCPFVSLGQANHVGHYDAVKLLQQLFGGSLYEYHPKPPRVDHLTWQVTSRQAINCVDKIYPYLKIKKRHADLLKSFYKDAGEKTYRLTKKENKRRMVIWKKLRSINQKGKIHLQRLNEVTPKKAM